jgi:hypothetical protein
MVGVLIVLLSLVAVAKAQCVEITPAAPLEMPTWELEAELLVWWLRNGRIPPLLTTGPSAEVVLYGNEKLDVNRHLGGRLTVTRWLDDCQSLGIQASGFAIERNSRTFETESDGSRRLARPFIDAGIGTAASEIIAGFAPGIGNLSGAFYGFTKNELFGEQGSVVVSLADGGLELDLLAGAYFLQMRERLEITATSKLLPDEAVLFGTTDKYKVYNRFYGAHLGVQGEVWRGCWLLGFHGQCAIGATTQKVNAYGDRLAATPLSRDWQPQGLLVQPTNAGKSDHATFDVVYELGLRLGCQATSWLRLHAGYTLIYWTNPIRAGDQIDLASYPSGPRIPFTEDYFWAQGASVGLEVSW